MNATEVAQTKRCSQAARNRHCKTDGEKAEMGDATKNKTETVQQTFQDPFASLSFRFSFLCLLLSRLLVPQLLRTKFIMVTYVYKFIKQANNIT